MDLFGKLFTLVLLGFGVYVGIIVLDACRGENFFFFLIGLVIGLGFILTYGFQFITELLGFEVGSAGRKTGVPDTFLSDDDGED